jgi:type VI secretion system secreted protein VgrG
MQYGEDDLRFITRLLGEVGIWFRFTADTRLNIDVVEFCDSQQGYEKGLTLPRSRRRPAVAGVDAVWGWSHHHVVQKQVSTRDYNYRRRRGHERAGGCHPREPPPTVRLTTGRITT